MLSHREALALNRRVFMYRLGYGLGGLAFTSLLAREQASAGVLTAKKPMVPTKIKSCIFLLTEGGPSHIDTFDPKPKLAEMHMKEFMRESKFASAMESANVITSKARSSFAKRENRALIFARISRISRITSMTFAFTKGRLPKASTIDSDVSFEHGKSIQRRSGDWRVGDLRFGNGERKSSGVRGLAQIRLSARRLGELVE